jgi:hypothetical protein
MKNNSSLSIIILLFSFLSSCNNSISKNLVINNTNEILTKIITITPTITITKANTSTITHSYRTYTQSFSSTKLFVPTPDDIIGTVWDVLCTGGEFNNSHFDIIIQENGKLIVIDRSYISKNDTWKIRGTILTLYIGDGYSIYKGKFIDKNHVIGTAKNINGSEWKWTASYSHNY